VLSVSIFSAPPYTLGPAQIGLTNLPLLIVSLIGSPLSGWAADSIAKFMARRNNGVSEPEFRLVLMFPATLFATIAFLGFGMSTQSGMPIAVPLTFMSIHGLSVPFASTASLTYVVDCRPRDANQALVTINFTKAVFTFAATTYANGWLARVGPRGVFDVITLVNLGICALTVPAYVFGKRFRSHVSIAQGVAVVETRTLADCDIGCTECVWSKTFRVDEPDTCVLGEEEAGPRKIIKTCKRRERVIGEVTVTVGPGRPPHGSSSLYDPRLQHFIRLMFTAPATYELALISLAYTDPFDVFTS
jgi:hypothetical protein